MASKKKQKGMVFHEEGATALTAAAAPPPARFAVLKPGKAREGGLEQGGFVTNEESDMMVKSNMFSKEVINASALPTMKHPASLNSQSDNLSPDSICKGIKVTLDNNSMWNEFFRCRTEMILTKQGSRMFPYCRFRITGLEPTKQYSLIMDIQPIDNSRYKWTGQNWQVAGKAERHVKGQPFAHPESPSTGQCWMQNPVSFYKLRLTGDISDSDGNIVLHAMHRYLPRLHVIQSDKAAKDIKLNGPHVVTFTFPQTEFMAVTAYQNSRFAQLKVDYNPFAKGLKEDGSSSWALKLKSITGKDTRKEGSTTTNEQHPVKKNLKSLLANHKPRSSKIVDQKPLTPEVQKTSSKDKDESTAKPTGESSCSNARPTQKLFSELIREAHVSLKRCNLEQLRISNSTTCKIEQTDIKDTTVKSKGKDAAEDSLSLKTHTEISSAKTADNVTKKNTKSSKGDKHRVNSLNCKDTVLTNCTVVNDKSSATPAPASTVSLNSSADSDCKSKAEAKPEENARPHKRPAPLPLPALALFLKQHRLKPRQVKTTPKSPTAAPTESMLETSHSTAPCAGPLPDHTNKPADPSKDPSGEMTKPGSPVSICTGSDLDPDRKVVNVTDQAAETGHQASSPSCQTTVAATDHGGPRADCLPSVPVAVSQALGSVVPDGAPVLTNPDEPIYTSGAAISTISSSLTTSSSCPMLSSDLNAVLPVPNLPQTLTFTESTTLPSRLSTMKPDPLLPDSECSPFGFEPLSPASSPEPLPSLPASLELELSPPPPGLTSKVVPHGPLPHSEDSAASVFKWHTVLPLPDPFETTFIQHTPQPASLSSSTTSLLPSQTPSHSGSQVLTTATSSPADAATSFQENDQSLPFPAELSPLALQLPLSPTFSSLDGDGLSPTPSIADLVHFFSTDDDLAMEVDFSNTEAATVPCPPPTTVTASAQGPSQQVQPSPANKPQKCKKKSRRGRPPLTDKALKKDEPLHTSMQPNLEEVEEQLFVSFTSKEALRLHLGDSPEGTGVSTQPQKPSESEPQESTETAKNVEAAESLEERITSCEKVLLRDMKLMKHRQVIHPVLQEVGLKMNLLDPALAIDLQYLGVCLPIPPPGVSLEPPADTLAPSQGVSAAFVSRTGKTTDVTQIKGWRDKFAPSETLSAPSASNPEVAPSSEVPKKNLSAFCSDMLDEYLENEGKLIDERAASFSQAAAEPVVYELPTRSTSYVRTLDDILKKQPLASPTSALISGFVPPSKRPKLPPMGLKKSRKTIKKEKAAGSKQNKLKASTLGLDQMFPAAAPDPEQHAVWSSSPTKANKSRAGTPPSEHTAPITESQTDFVPRSKKKHFRIRADAVLPPFDHTAPITYDSEDLVLKRRKKLKKRSAGRSLSPSVNKTSPLGVSEDMAPLESDSELGNAAEQSSDTSKTTAMPLVTKALLKQKDLEDGVVWEGRPRTCITEERAAIALTSLFTLMGFVSENPTAPIQIIKRRAPPCLNEFCRLGCVCSSLAQTTRITHCGRAQCMFGCSCLKQKVVLLKNLDGPDSSPSDQVINRKRKRKKRMKMAYILKEADSVSQPAQRVRTLWKKESEDTDPDPTHAPDSICLPWTAESGVDDKSCARVRAFTVRKTTKHSQKEGHGQSKDGPPKAGKKKDAALKKAKIKSSNPPAEPHQPAPTKQPAKPPAEPEPTPSKRLSIMAECQWHSEADRNYILQRVCQAMAHDRLDKPFWIKTYLITPLSQSVEDDGVNRCVHYKVHITEPKLDPTTTSAPAKPQEQVGEREEEGLEDWQKEVEEEEEEECLDDWQKEVEEDEEEERLEDWQGEEMEDERLEDRPREEEAGDIKQKENLADTKEDNSKEKRGQEVKESTEKIKMMKMGLPFLTGISPAGFLSAKRRERGGSDHVVQVNGKLYPLAKIQLGGMGALHPANRLAAYLTGRVGPVRHLRGPAETSSSSSSLSSSSSSSSTSCSSSSKPCQALSSSASPQAGATTTLSSAKRTVTVVSVPRSSTVAQPTVVKADQSGPTSTQPPPPQPGPSVAPLPPFVWAGVGPPQTQHLGLGHQMLTVVFPASQGGASHVRVVPAGSFSSAPIADSKVAATQVTPSVVSPPNPSPGSAAPSKPQVLMIKVPGASGTGPVQNLLTRPLASAPSTTSQRIVLQTVRTPLGNQIFRKVDGKLVQLVPVNQVRGVNPNLVVQRALAPTGPSSTAVLPITSLPGSAGAISTQPQPLTSTMTTVTTTTASLPGLPAFSVPTLSTSFPPGSGVLGQKETCTLKIVSTNSNKEPLLVTCPKVPPLPQTTMPVMPGAFTLLQPPQLPSPALISLKPSGGQGIELGVKTVTVSTVPVGSGGAVDLSMGTASSAPAPPPTPCPTPPPAPPLELEIKADQPVASSASSLSRPSIDLTSPGSPELASDLVDLDIVCVDDEIGYSADETVDGAQIDKVRPSPDRKQEKDLGVVDLVESSSEETDNSSDDTGHSDSDSGQDLAVRISARRHIHSALERSRRVDMSRRFHGLRKELGLENEKTTKIAILTKAQQEIFSLWQSSRNLKGKKMKLKKKRAEYIAAVAQRTGESAEIIYRNIQRASCTQRSANNFLPGGLEPKPPKQPVDHDLMEVVNVEDESEELTDNSSDEENVVMIKKNASNDDNMTEVEVVDIEMVEECSELNPAQRKLAMMMKSRDSERVKSFYQQVAAGFRVLSSVLNMESEKASKLFLLQQACKEIQLLQDQARRLESQRTSLTQQRSAYINEISLRSGKSKQRILRKLQHLSAKQMRLEAEQGKRKAAKPPPGGAAANQPSESTTAGQPAGDAGAHGATPQPQTQQTSVISSRTPAAPPTAPPTALSAAQPSPTKRVVIVPTPLLAPPTVSHNPSVARERPRTIPNILSRRKVPPPLSAEPVPEDHPSIQALVPTEVLSLVGAALPGQQVVTLSPLVQGPTLLQTPPTPGVASVTLNISNLTNQHLRLASLPQPPPAQNFPTMLHLAQTPPPQQVEPPPPPQVVSSDPAVLKTLKMFPKVLIKLKEVPTQTSTHNQDQDQDQDKALSEAQDHAPGTSSLSGPSAPESDPSPSLGQSAGRAAGGSAAAGQEEEEAQEEEEEVKEAEVSEETVVSEMDGREKAKAKGKEQKERGEEDSDGESLTSLLNEIVFLNQQIGLVAEGATPTSPPTKHSSEPRQEAAGGQAPPPDLTDAPPTEGRRSQSPVLLEVSEDLSGSASEREVVMNGHTDAQTGPQPGPATAGGLSPPQNPQCTGKGGALTPPPLLQMKAGGGGAGGGAAPVEPSVDRAGGREAGVAWRPMPRLVPLGLRSNTQT